jgi:hypothetical protein
MSEVNNISPIDKNNFVRNPSKKVAESNTGFSSFLGETKNLDNIFDEASKKHNVPLNLLKAIGKQESNFNAKAVSRCGAQGIMQLMPATAKELGVSDSFNPEQNIMGGAKYISGLLKKYKGDASLALAAYNAGSGNVAKYGGIPPFKETQNYVKKVLNYAGQNLNEEIALASSKIGTSATQTVSGASSYNPVPVAKVQNNLAVLLANSSGEGISEFDYLDSIFSYDDYLKFVDIFLDEEKDNSEEKKSDYTTKDINYNVAVMNLLKDQKQI